MPAHVLCSLERMDKAVPSRKYSLVGLANQEGLALPGGKRKGRVSAEPLFAGFSQQWCFQLLSNLSSCPFQDLPHELML